MEADRTLEADELNIPVKCTYDAGSLGCGEGLHMEFRRQMHGLEVGESMEFLVRDPSAKEDLPPLARMMGFRIRSHQQRDDGVLSLVVERAR